MVEWGVDEVKVVVDRGILVDGSRGSGGGRGGKSGSTNFDPLACYRCGVHGHLVRDCPQSKGQSGGSSTSSSSRGTFSKSGQKGPQRGRGRGRQVRFAGLNVLYDDEGNSYPINNAGQLYVPLDFGQTVAESAEVEMEKNTKKLKRTYASVAAGGATLCSARIGPYKERKNLRECCKYLKENRVRQDTVLEESWGCPGL